MFKFPLIIASQTQTTLFNNFLFFFAYEEIFTLFGSSSSCYFCIC